MARLANGLETMELGVTSWRVIINDNFTKIYSKGEVDTLLRGDALKDFTVKDIDLKGIIKFSSILPSSPLPTAPDGYIKAVVNGENVKIPYYKDA